jgi:pilus assembly protein Flp/PilA
MFNDIKSFALSLWTRVLVSKEEGQAMVEYGLILALVSVVAIATLAIIGTDVKGAFESIVTELEAA